MEWYKAWVRAGCVGIVCISLGTAVSPASVDALNDFSRYQVILDSQPFGEPLSAEDLARQNAVAPQPELPPFTKELKLCFIGEGPMGQRIGFFNIKSKQSYYLYLNQTSEDGITVTQIDYQDEKALLKKDDKEHWLAIGATTLASPTTGTGGRAAPAKAPRDVATRSTLKRTSYAERLRQRRQAIQSPKLEGEDLKKYLQKYQMELIRKGQPPLPMPLTKEMDDQLVQEGVLPPTAE